MSRTMTEVLAEHIPHTESLAHCSCGNYHAWTSTSHAEHVADMLAAAGFGDVREQQARLDKVEAVASRWDRVAGAREMDNLIEHDPEIWLENRTRAMTLRSNAHNIRAALTATEGS